MYYKNLEENTVFKAGKEYGKFTAKQIMPHAVQKRNFTPSEKAISINDGTKDFKECESK